MNTQAITACTVTRGLTPPVHAVSAAGRHVRCPGSCRGARIPATTEAGTTTCVLTCVAPMAGCSLDGRLPVPCGPAAMDLPSGRHEGWLEAVSVQVNVTKQLCPGFVLQPDPGDSTR
jgi:hypothetical protein